MWGCDGPCWMPVAQLDGEDLYECPKRPFCQNPGLYRPAFDAFAWMKRGFLPDDGSWLDQTVVFNQVCDLIEAVLAQLDAERLNDAKSGG